MTEQLAYLAGLMDGEGSFSIQVQVRQHKGRYSVNFSPKMTMTLKHGSDVLDELVGLFGGTVYHYTDNPAKIEHRWSLGRRESLISAAASLRPFLRIKGVTCDRFLEALAMFPTKRADHLAGERTWDLATVLAVADIATTLNPESAQKAKYGRKVLEALDLIYA